MPSESASSFPVLRAEVVAIADRFGHRQHVRLTWLAVQQHTRFYRSSTLASEAARRGWVAPDLEPFPFLLSEPPAAGRWT